MSHFDLAIESTFRHEGGFVDDPVDPGGATKYGVSLRWLKTQGMYGDYDGDGDVDAQDVESMTKEQARLAYLDFFWTPNGYDRINDERVAIKIFDMTVNMGARQSHKLVQRALHATGQTYLVIDGIMGPRTMEAINNSNPYMLIGALRAEQAAFYRALIKSNPELQRFAHGWKRRAYA